MWNDSGRLATCHSYAVVGDIKLEFWVTWPNAAKIPEIRQYLAGRLAQWMK